MIGWGLAIFIAYKFARRAENRSLTTRASEIVQDLSKEAAEAWSLQDGERAKMILFSCGERLELAERYMDLLSERGSNQRHTEGIVRLRESMTLDSELIPVDQQRAYEKATEILGAGHQLIDTVERCFLKEHY